MSEAETQLEPGLKLFRAALARTFALHAGASDSVPPKAVWASNSFEDNSASQQDVLKQFAEETANRVAWDSFHRRKRRRLRLSLGLFLLTFLSTTLVGAHYWPIEILSGYISEAHRVPLLRHLNEIFPTLPGVTYTVTDRFWQSVRMGCTYSVPLMIILLCHEMGHYLQAVRYRVPASFPFFIPLPLPPLGTMGAVILQGKGTADRKMMFDIAVSGPLAGLLVTLPVLYYGIATSGYAPTEIANFGFEFGQPALVRWLIELIHGPAADGTSFVWTGFATAGWVGIFITAMNLLPIGQLDGGHIMYTLVGRKAHYVAWALILVAVAAMLLTGMYSYVLLLILLTLTGPRHPPTANDRVPIGLARTILGWATLAFLFVGFTFQPIVVTQPDQPPQNQIEQLSPEQLERLLTP